jgi:hypothetical protein
MFYRGLVIASFIQEHKITLKSFSIFDEQQGRSKIDLDEVYFKPNGKSMKSIDFLRVPRLDWDHREITYDFVSTGIQIPRKLLIAGEYDQSEPFVALIDTRPKVDQTLIKCFA